MERTEELLKKLNRKKMPGHIAIIMDGNGRWAKEKGLPRIAGHKKGVDRVREIVRFTGNLLPEVKVLTLYVFSTENWTRPKTEVACLMELIAKYLLREVPELDRNNVRMGWIGRRSGLPKSVLDSLSESMGSLEDNTGLIMNLAINYGGRTEILDALKSICEKVSAGGMDPSGISENEFGKHLYTAGLPDLDLLIRTGGEMRISNFLLWQVAYAEILITPVYWPDFTPRHLTEAIIAYQERERRFGAV